MQTRCPRCKAEVASTRYDLGREKIVCCGQCQLLYLHPWPDPEETRAVYSEDYFQNEKLLEGGNNVLFGYVDYIAERFNKQPQNAKIARELQGLLSPLDRPPRLLEVGCGLGYFLDEAFEEGFAVTGVEFNEHAVSRLRQKYAFPILSGSLETLDLPRGHYDAIAMFDVIEHLRDPFSCLDKLYESLAPGGILVVTTVDAESATSRLIGKRLEDFRRTREHLIFFGRRTLSETAREHGFDPLYTRSIGHTFQLSFLLQRLALYQRSLFTGLRRLVDRIGLGNLQISVNPRTKMVMFARRRGRRVESHREADAELDRTLISELDMLDAASERHYRWVADVIAPHLGDSVLEIGSGVGVISKWLLPRCRSLVLSDHETVYLERLRERFGDPPHLRYQLLDLNDRPYRVEGARPDTVVCLNVLEHIEDDREALAGLAELLPPGGKVVLQVPNYPVLYGSLDRSYGHHRRYSRRSLRAVLEAAGFEDVEIRSFNWLSIPGWILSSLLGSPRLNPSAVRLYDALVPLARRLDVISRIAGLSLIAVARRR